jgi:hypothetical protein
LALHSFIVSAWAGRPKDTIMTLAKAAVVMPIAVEWMVTEASLDVREITILCPFPLSLQVNSAVLPPCHPSILS